MRRLMVMGMLIVSLSILLVSSAFAQDGPKSSDCNPCGPKVSGPLTFPGNFWISTGELSPSEGNNFTTYSHFEQGVTLYHSGHNFIIPFVSVDASFDTKGYDWNNRAIFKVGGKYVHTFKYGVVQTSLGYAYEQRFKGGKSQGQPFASADYWFGWQAPQKGFERGAFKSFPGSTWGVIGNLSPQEHGNVIAMLDLTQGVTLVGRKNYDVIPFGRLRYSVDSKGYDWNNKVMTGVGIKLAVPQRSGIFEVGVQYLYEDRRLTGRKDTSLSVFANVWFGYSMARR